MNNLNFLKGHAFESGTVRPQAAIIRSKYKPIYGIFMVFAVSFVFIFSVLNYRAIYDQALYLTGSLPSIDSIDVDKEMATDINLYGEITDQVNALAQATPFESDSANNLKLRAIKENPTPVAGQKNLNQAPAAADIGIAGDYIYIPKLNVRAPIIVSKSADSGSMINDLKSGVAIYPGSAFPGQPGSTVIIGHSSSPGPGNKYGSVFALLNNLTNGDQIVIYFNAQKYTYSVNDKLIGSPQQLAEAQLSGELILGSCWPVGTNKGRILISSTLQSI
jgi:LPXTG-site transpeptidase (sortase) family protein